jgi:hypothetical protein
MPPGRPKGFHPSPETRKKISLALTDNSWENPIIKCANVECLEQFPKYYIKRNGHVRWCQPRKYCKKHAILVASLNLVTTHCKKHVITQVGSLHHSWRGDDVGYSALHSYAKKHFPKTGLCQKCLKVSPNQLACIKEYRSDIYMKFATITQ